MITRMRQQRRLLQVALIVVVVAFVATSVFVLGQSGPGGHPRDAVAVVNGETITVERYQRAFQNYIAMLSQASQRTVTSEMAERMGLPAQVLDALVTETLIVQRARAEGLEATDRELNEFIYTVPAFQEGGRFSLGRYREVLRRNGLTEAAFERDLRRDLTRRKVEELVRSGVRVADAEVEEAWALRREEVRVAWAVIDLEPLVTAATASDEELQAYLREHGHEFRQPERRRIRYVAVDPREVRAPVTDAEVEQYYREHTAEFETPQQVRAAHILARVPDTGGSAAEDRARGKVAEAIRRAQAGEDFAALARELSEDPGSAPNGGDLGLVRAGEMVPDFERALFALEPGRITPEPVRTPFGYHAIKAIEVRAASRRPLSEAAPEIRERLAEEAADRAARARAEEVRAALLAADDFMAEARRLGLEPIETTVARLGGSPLGPDPLEDAAFGLTLGGVAAPFRTPVGWMVVQSVEALPAGVPPLAEITDAVAEAVKRQKAEQVAREQAEQLAAAARSGDLAAAARQAGATTGEPERFSRARPGERLPGDAQLAALQTPAGQVTAPVRTGRGYYVLRVLERFPPDPAGLADERESLAREVLAQKQNRAWEAWVSSVRAAAKIEMVGGFAPPRRG